MNRIHLTCLVLLHGVLLCGVSVAEDDVVPDSAISVKFDFAQSCQIDSRKFLLESATLADVVRALSGGRIINTSKSSDADPLWAVYFRSGENVVRFEADGDMGGDEHRLTGVSVGPAAEFSNARSLPIMSGRLIFKFGEIGMKFSDFEQVMGRAVLRKNIAWYKYEGRSVVSTRKDIRGMATVFDVSAFLSVQVVGGRIDAISISHITTS